MSEARRQLAIDLPSPAEVETALLRALQASSADSARANLRAYRRGFIRFARGEVTTAGIVTDLRVQITTAFGRKHATTTTQSLRPEALKRAVAASEMIARLAPDDPEWVGDLPPQRAPRVPAFDEPTALSAPEPRARLVEQALSICRQKSVVGAGFVDSIADLVAVANKRGFFAHHRQTAASATITARTSDGQGSGWAATSGTGLAQLEVEPVWRRAVDKAVKSQGARALPPGRYQVVLEPAATSTFLSFFGFALNRRDAEEGRGAFSRGKGQTRLGEKMFAPQITISSDPYEPTLPTAPFDGEGQLRRRTVWSQGGNLTQLATPRYWAQKRGIEPEPFPASMTMEGGSTALPDLIKGCQKGLLVTRFWYANLVDPRVLLVTGLTRDGVFAIERGEITHPVRNFRFNNSVFDTFREVEAIGPTVRGEPSRWVPMRTPAMRVNGFLMSSSSDAI